MYSTDGRHHVTSSAGTDRRIPSWAAGLLAGLARDLPTVITREELAGRLAEAGSARDVESTIAELRRLGWLASLPLHGAWAFIPPGQDRVVDPYIDLRAWRAREPTVEFCLAGAAAAWHLAYLDRSTAGRIPLWLPRDLRLPDGLRTLVSVVRISWPIEHCDQLGPNPAMLVRRQLDIVSWASGLPAFGPEALVVQLAARPGSFEPWADLVAHLDALAADCDERRLVTLLGGQSASTWQRAAYLLQAGGQEQRGLEVLEQRPPRPMPTVRFEGAKRRAGGADGDSDGGLWVPQYRLVDRLIAPLQGLVGKG